MDNTKFAQNLRKARKDVGVTQKELANRLGVTPQNISQYERGLKSPTFGTAEKIAEALGVSTIGLLVGYEFPCKKIIQAQTSLEAAEAESFADNIRPYIYSLNEEGQKMLIKYAEFLCTISEYLKLPDNAHGNISDTDNTQELNEHGACESDIEISVDSDDIDIIKQELKRSGNSDFVIVEES